MRGFTPHSSFCGKSSILGDSLSGQRVMTPAQQMATSKLNRQGKSQRHLRLSDRVSTTPVVESVVSIGESNRHLYVNRSQTSSERIIYPFDRLSEQPTAVSNPADITESGLPSSAEEEKGIYLDLETLQGFEVANHQFEHWGIQFRNAIALQPSNPAYPPKSGSMVLIAGPKSGWMEVLFTQPIRAVSCYVTSSRRITLTGFNRENEAIAYTELSEANLATLNDSIAPNALLTLITETPDIYRINFSAFDGQFSVDDFYFYWD